jgi:hypothetical protein
MSTWKAVVLDEIGSIELSGNEYDYLVTTNLLPRISFNKSFIGFYVNVSVLILTLKEDDELSEDEGERALLKDLIAKLTPFIGKNLFLP